MGKEGKSVGKVLRDEVVGGGGGKEICKEDAKRCGRGEKQGKLLRTEEVCVVCVGRGGGRRIKKSVGDLSRDEDVERSKEIC